MNPALNVFYFLETFCVWLGFILLLLYYYIRFCLIIVLLLPFEHSIIKEVWTKVNIATRRACFEAKW